MVSPQMIKLFVGIETNLAALERDVNGWITSSGAEVINILGNLSPQTQARDIAGQSNERRFAPSDILIIVVYRPKAG